MFSYRTDIAECIVRNEIKEWFKKLAHEACGPDVQINYLSNEIHFNTHTYVEITGNQNQIKQAILFLQDTSDILNYKMPWLSENSYYVYSDARMERAEEQLKTLKNANYDIPYIISWSNLFGLAFQLFNFRPDLHQTIKLKLDKIFKSVSEPTTVFISSPKTGVPQIEPSSTSSIIGKGTNILTTFHGQFLPYLSEEDILSLEIANGGCDSCYDDDLNHDIQQYLKTEFPVLYDEAARVDRYNLKGYKINKVLRYFIYKYHDRFNQIDIPAILTEKEIQSLSHLYKIKFLHYNRVHIDFKSTNETNPIDFCAISHYDPNNGFFLNYGSKYATENYILKFNGDDLLESLSLNTDEYSSFVIKSFNKCSPQKTNSVLKFVVKHFRACRNTSELVLSEFDLNVVSSEVLSSLVNKPRDGWLLFDTMNFNLRTLIAILEQSDRLAFRNCQFAIEISATFSNESKIRNLRFYDMDVEISVLCMLKNIEWLLLKNCRIFDTNPVLSHKMEVSDHFKFYHTIFDINTLLKLLSGLQCVRQLTFISCHLSGGHIEINHFKVLNVVHFINMVFSVQTLLQIFGTFEFRNRIKFENCHFPLEKYENHKYSLKPIEADFYKIKFDSTVLIKILEALNSVSNVKIYDSCILHLDDVVNTTTKLCQIESLQFTKCEFETQTLLQVLGHMSYETKVIIDNCNLILRPSRLYSVMPKKLSNIVFQNMTIKSKDLFAFLTKLKNHSSVVFRECIIIAESDDQWKPFKIRLQPKIKIQFINMTVESHITRLILENDAVILFDNCDLDFLKDAFSLQNIQSAITFRNMEFKSSDDLKSLAEVTFKSVITFDRCQFLYINLGFSKFKLNPAKMIFKRTFLNFELVVTILRKLSDQTEVVIDKCVIRPAHVFFMLEIKVQNIRFVNMNFENSTILYILQCFSSLINLRFDNCKLQCSYPNDLECMQFKSTSVFFSDMDFDVQIFETLFQKCIEVTVVVDNCKIIPPNGNTSILEPRNIERFAFKNMKYTSDLLKLLQYFNGLFIVEYHGHLSNHDIIEICTNSLVNGERLRLVSQTYKKSIYFELFAEFFSSSALNFYHDTNIEYDVPAYLVPNINSAGCDMQYWNAFKIKFVSVNSSTVKIEFLRDGTPIELFEELNGLSNDFDLNDVLNY